MRCNRHIALTMLLLLFFPQAHQAAGKERQDSLFQTIAALPHAQQVDSLNEWAYDFKNEPDLALNLAREALRLSKEDNYKPGEALAWKRMASVHRGLGHADSALAYNLVALPLFESLQNQKEAVSVMYNIGNLYLDRNENALARTYFQRALPVCMAEGLTKKAALQHQGIGISHEEEHHYDSAFYHYRRSLLLATQEADTPQIASVHNNLGTCHFKMARLDSAGWYWPRSYATFTALENESECANLLNNLGLLRKAYGQPQAAIDSFFRPAIAIATRNEDAHQQKDILQNIAEAFADARRFDSAYHYLKAYMALHDTIFAQERSDKVAELETRYQVAQKDAQNQLLQADAQRKTIVLIAVSGFALLLAGAGWYVLRQQRRRHRIQRELAARRQQEDALRIVDLIQTQELRALEALVEGQEQERSRLATELHDGLGSLLATVKLYFGQVEGADQTGAFHKADQLLDDACKELRRYSHDLAGLPVAQFGLLNAVRDLADSISGAGRLQVRVYAHQLEERLPLPLERSVYKVIQELLTNAIKHAQASEVSIQISRHPQHLNLIVEDNGRGMDTRLQVQGKGLGLRSVRARVETLGGEFVLDSRPGHGTTALIDLPIEEHPHE